MEPIMNKMEMECTSDDRSLSFTTSPEDYDMGFMKKPKVIRDPLSHRIIEKRRRDRMNNCLADLSRLIPSNYLKQGQGRIEKTEIIEMAIKLIKSLTNIVSKHGGLKSKLPDRYLGFKECQDEVMRYLVQVEEWDASDKLCHRMMAHLEQQGEKFRIMNDESLSQTAREEQYRHADEDMGVATETIGNTEQHVKEQQYAKPPSINSLFCNGPNNMNSSNMESEISFDGNNYKNAEQVMPKNPQYKQMWTMLSDKENMLPENIEDSGISVGTYSNNTGPGRMYHLDTAITNSGQKSGDIRTDACHSSGDSANGSTYKFKHNITKRFAQQGTDTTSSYSGSMDLPCRKIRLGDDKSSCSPYSSSRHSKSVFSSIPSSEATDSNKDSKDGKCTSLLPAFMLHPKGTHYIPLSIHPQNVNSSFFREKVEPNVGPSVYHPISIPVNFDGPVLYMKKISSNPSSKCPSTSPSNSIGSSGSPESFDVLETSSGSSVDKNTSPPTLGNTDIKI